MTSLRLRRTTCGLAVALSVPALVVPACGGDGPPEAQPAPEVTRFAEGAFEDIPLFPRSESVGARNEKSNTTARSFKARNATPEQVLGFYDQRLAGWQVVSPVDKVGATAYRGEWTKDGRRLLVSATPAPGLGASDEIEAPVTQYSLSITHTP